MSTITSHPATERLDFRIAPELKRIIAKAAAALGQTLTDYAVSRLVETAKHDLREHEQTVLSDRDRDAFLALLSGDAEPAQALKRAARRYKRVRV